MSEMYPFLHELLSDKKGGEVFSCFGIWHLGYILAAAVIGLAVFFCLKRRGGEAAGRASDLFLHVSFGLYLADFFLMPLAFGEIDIEKLPFHVCTAMCVMCFVSRHCRRLKGCRIHFALLGFLSNLVYLIYPAGVMWHQVHPLSYRVIQTLLFHGLMTLFGLFALLSEGRKLRWKDCRRDLLVIVGMTLWAVIGNAVYNGQAGDYDHFFNWFFVVQDPFYLLPAGSAPFVMPVVNVVIFFAAELLIYAVCIGVNKRLLRTC